MFGFTYGFIGQILEARRARKSPRESGFKRTAVVQYLCCAFYLGFLVSYLLNLFISWKNPEIKGLTSDNTGFSCLVFLILLVVVKFIILPKIRKQDRNMEDSRNGIL